MKWCRIILAALLATVPVALTSAVDVRAYVIAKTNGEIAANTTRVEECIADMNEVFAQIGLGFVVCQCSIVTSNELWVVDYTNAASRVSLCNYATNPLINPIIVFSKYILGFPFLTSCPTSPAKPSPSEVQKTPIPNGMIICGTNIVIIAIALIAIP